MIDSIIKENERRRAVASAPFDPVSGRGSVGERFGVKLPHSGESLFLPVSMSDEPLVKLLVDGRIKPDDPGFITLRIRHDFPFWAASFAYIKRKGGGEDILFSLNRPQRRLISILEKMRQEGKPIRLLLLKARQWGGSTCIQLYMAWLQLCLRCGLNSLIIAHQAIATDEIKDMFDRLMAAYPPELLIDSEGNPAESKEKKTEKVGRGGAITRVIRRNCKIKVGTAERPDSCRGGDYSLVHCSEVGIWKATAGKQPEHILRAACSGVLLEPLTMIVYESTANGTGNFFHREYEAARRGESQFQPMFVPWFEIDQYSLPIRDIRDFVIKLYDNRNCEASASDRAQPGKYLWWLWESGASLEAINWYIAERSKYSDHGLMAAEYPSDDVEAFVHSGASVFDRYKVEALRPACMAPRWTGEIESPVVPRGGSLPDAGFRKLQLEEVQFSPMSGGGGGWKIWELPEVPLGSRIPDRYVTVVDVGGRGAKADWSVIAVFDREPMMRGRGPEVVAQWRGHCDFDILAWKAALAASLYDDALLVIESNSIETRDPERHTDGDQSSFLFNRLRDVYPNLYARRRSEEEIVRGIPLRYGFHTNMATKPLIIGGLVEVVREGLYTERDQAALDEMLAYERRPNGSFGAVAGAHDDLLMTRAIGLHICFHELEQPVRSNIASHASPSFQRPGNHAVW